MIFSLVLILIVSFLIFYFRLYLFLYPKNRLPILMYHKVEKSSPDDLTVDLANLEKQFKYLSESGYRSIFFSEIQIPAKRRIILTFDDGYKNNFDYLPSLLEKYHLKATIFIATRFIQQGYENYEIMTFQNLKDLNENYFEIGLHSHSHENFRNVSVDFIEEDLRLNREILDQHGVKYQNILAYPYGKYYKSHPEKGQLFSVLKKLGITFAVRIGNKVNFFPTQDPYELCRIDVKGSDTLLKFRLKLIFGRLKFF